MPHRKINFQIAYYDRTLFIIKAFCYKIKKDYHQSLLWFNKCLNVNLKNNQLYVVCKNIVILSERLNQPVKKEIIQNCQAQHNSAMDLCIKNDIFFIVYAFLNK